MPNWATDYFERGYSQRWALAPPSADVRQQAEGLSTLLRLSAGSRVIDVGCGHGRHTIALAERGADVIGVDASGTLLTRARQLAAELQTPVPWIRGDMRQLALRSGCADAAILLDALGFFDTEEEHHAVLEETARVLKPGGRVVLKVVNGPPIISDFRQTALEERDGAVIAITNTLALDPPRLTQKITISGTRGHGQYERRQRLFRSEELSAMLENAGFTIANLFASSDGARFESVVSPAMWFVAQRGSKRRASR